jgi:hypothetical protein
LKDLLTDALAFLLVVAVVSSITLLAFDVPARPPPRAVSTAPLKPGKADERLNEIFARAVRSLDQPPPGVDDATLAAALASARATAPAGANGVPGTVTGGGALPPSGLDTRAAPPEGSQTMNAISALGAAIRASRDARTEKDLLVAEERLRAARQQMESTCGVAAGPLCDGARQMRELGY